MNEKYRWSLLTHRVCTLRSPFFSMAVMQRLLSSLAIWCADKLRGHIGFYWFPFYGPACARRWRQKRRHRQWMMMLWSRDACHGTSQSVQHLPAERPLTTAITKRPECMGRTLLLRKLGISLCMSICLCIEIWNRLEIKDQILVSTLSLSLHIHCE